MISAAEVLNCSVFELRREPSYWVSYAMLHLDAVAYRDEQAEAAQARQQR